MIQNNQPIYNTPQPQQYPRIYYQRSTRNQSFKNMSDLLKAMGIKNYRFMLTTFDPDVIGLDPYDPNLTLVQKTKILREIKRNYWYFLREVARVPVTGNPQGSMYNLNRGNLAFNFCALYNLNVFFEMPRQQGKTMAAALWYLYIYNFGSTGSEITFMHKDMTGAKDNLQRVKACRELLPDYLQMSQEYSMVNGKKKRLPSTVQTMTNSITHNMIRTVASARNQMAAANLLRGRTITMLWADEWAFAKFNDVVYTNGMPALNTAFNNAKRNGSPYGFIITTTAGILSTDEGKYAYRMLNNATPFDEHWYDLSYPDIINLISSNMNSTFVYIKFTWKQLGLSNEWFQNLCKQMEWNMVDIRREINLEWIDTPENSPFTQDQIESLRGQIHEPIKTELIGNKYKFNIYKMLPLNLNKVPINPPIIGVDVSGGFHRDYSAITVIDSATTDLIAELKCNYLSIPELAKVIVYIMKNMTPNAVINIERNGGFGASLIAILRNAGYGNNLYYEIKERVIEETLDAIGRPVRRKQKTKVYGTDNTKDTREKLIEILRERMERHKDKFHSPTIFDELSKMVVKRSGKVEHSDNSHDDLVFSYLMAMYVWYEGKQLKERFHINKTTIRTEDDEVDEALSPIEGEVRKYTEIIEEMILPDDEDKVKQEIKEQLTLLREGMGYTYQEFMKQQLQDEHEMLMQMLSNKVIKEAYSKSTGMSVQNIDDMMVGHETIIPAQVFNNFNMGITQEEADKALFEKNMNFSRVDPGQ